MTGAGGFIGRQCVPELLNRGYEVHAVSSHPNASHGQRVHWHSCDLMNEESVEELVTDTHPSHLLHLAWYTRPGEFWASWENLRWLGAGVALLRAFAKSGGQRAAFAGTCAEYDWRFARCNEELTPTNPATLYGVCKKALSEVAMQFGQISGISVAWGRLFYLYGPHEASGRLIPSIARGILRRRPIPCTTGEQLRDYLHVQDAAAALVVLLDSGFEGAANIGSGRPITIREIVEKFAAALGGSELLEWGKIPIRAEEPLALFADVRRIAEIAGWKPRIELAAGLQATADWWRANHEMVRE